jgi:hypothetical protein
MNDQEKKPRTIMGGWIETLNQTPWSPMLDDNPFCSNFQLKLHQEAAALLRDSGVQAISSSRSDVVRIEFERHALSIFRDKANVQSRSANLDRWFKPEEFTDLDHLKQSVLRLLLTLHKMDEIGRAPFEEAIEAVMQKQIDSRVKIHNSKSMGSSFAFERLADDDLERVDWQRVAVELARAINTPVLAIFHSWAAENPSLDLTVVIFYFADLTESFWDNRNLIQPVDPHGTILQTKE